MTPWGFETVKQCPHKSEAIVRWILLEMPGYDPLMPHRLSIDTVGRSYLQRHVTVLVPPPSEKK
jgi:hypothetical protein